MIEVHCARALKPRPGAAGARVFVVTPSAGTLPSRISGSEDLDHPGWPYEPSVAIARMVFSGILDAHFAQATGELRKSRTCVPAHVSLRCTSAGMRVSIPLP
jgi:hypothetical protein